MSFRTGTSAEVFYETITAGTQLDTFTSEANLMGGLPYCDIPPAFWGCDPKSATGKCIKIKAWGRLGSTGTPTYVWTVRLLTSSTWSAGGLSVATTTLTTQSGVTLGVWELEMDITMRTLGVGAGSTLCMFGKVWSPLGLAAPYGGTIPTSNTAFTVTTFDASVTAYLFLSATCSASSGSNLIKLESMKVYGEN